MRRIQLDGNNYIGGEWIPPKDGGSRTRVNPFRPMETLAPIADSTPADVDAAAGAACQAYEQWSQLPGAARAAYLLRAAELVDRRAGEIGAELARETGKPIREAVPEVRRCAGIFRYYAGESSRANGRLFEHTLSGAPIRVQRRPRGVFALITPWNFPAAIPVWKLAPALILGNTVVLKLSEEASVTGLAIVQCLADAGLPPGVLNAVVGDGSVIGPALVRHPDICGVSFTGSLATGRSVRQFATELNKPVQLELGGQNPLLVMADCDLDRAVEAAYAGAYYSAGQKCTATRRIFVEQAIYATFRARLLDRIAAGIVGDPTDPATEVGPIVNRRQWESVWSGIERGSAEGGRRIAGSDRGPEDAGYFVPPTLFEGVADEGFLSREEVFGPVASLYSFIDLEDAIRRANAVSYGLSSSIFTNDIRSARRFTTSVQAGVIHVNSPTTGSEPHVPFGGLKASGWGPFEQGHAALAFYSDSVTVYEDL